MDVSMDLESCARGSNKLELVSFKNSLDVILDRREGWKTCHLGAESRTLAVVVGAGVTNTDQLDAVGSNDHFWVKVSLVLLVEEHLLVGIFQSDDLVLNWLVVVQGDWVTALISASITAAGSIAVTASVTAASSIAGSVTWAGMMNNFMMMMLFFMNLMDNFMMNGNMFTMSMMGMTMIAVTMIAVTVFTMTVFTMNVVRVFLLALFMDNMPNHCVLNSLVSLRNSMIDWNWGGTVLNLCSWNVLWNRGSAPHLVLLDGKS